MYDQHAEDARVQSQVRIELFPAFEQNFTNFSFVKFIRIDLHQSSLNISHKRFHIQLEHTRHEQKQNKFST